MNVLTLQKKLEDLSLPYCNYQELPPKPACLYSAVKIVGNLAYVSGQVPLVNNQP